MASLSKDCIARIQPLRSFRRLLKHTCVCGRRIGRDRSVTIFQSQYYLTLILGDCCVLGILLVALFLTACLPHTPIIPCSLSRRRCSKGSGKDGMSSYSELANLGYSREDCSCINHGHRFDRVRTGNVQTLNRTNIPRTNILASSMRMKDPMNLFKYIMPFRRSVLQPCSSRRHCPIRH
jgi:hypothetical protein